MDGRRVRGNGAQLTERAHHALHAGLRPAVAINSLYLMGRDQSGYPVVLDDDEAAASSSQHILVDEILQAQMTLHRSVVAVHDVGDTPVPESCHQLYLNVAGTGRIKQEPTDKRQPQPAKVRAYEESKQARQDKHKGDDLTYLGCQSRGTVGIASDPPDYGTQDTPAVERVTGNHV